MKTLSLLITLVLAQIASAKTLQELVAEGDQLDAKLKTSEALKVYLEAEKLAPKDASLLIKIAKQYGESMVDSATREGKIAAGNEALAYAKRAVALEPKLCDAHLAAAICYGRLLEFMPNKAKVEYSRSIKEHADKSVALDPKNDYAWHMLGRWHQSVSELNGLLKGLVAVVYGGLPDSSLDEAVDCFKTAAQLAPKRVAHPIELGRTYAMQGKKEEARKAIERGLALPNQERDDADTKARGKETLRKL